MGRAAGLSEHTYSRLQEVAFRPSFSIAIRFDRASLKTAKVSQVGNHT